MPVNFAVKAAVTVALTAANLALTMTRKIEGPRLDELKFSGGDYGAPLPMVWGLRRMDVPIFWAEDLREVRRRRKTKGGKFNEYTYFGTWAVALAGHEIEGVRRIWFDTHLIYDLSGAGPITPFDFGDNASGNVADYITIYTGTETQDPDPRMQATVEAQFGEGSCPAYRGTAYIVFKDIPLEKLGNRIPQVSVEIAGAAGSAWPYEETGVVYSDLFVSPDGATLVALVGSDTNDFVYLDTISRSQIVSGTRVPRHAANTPSIALNNNGEFFGRDMDGSDVYRYGPDGIGVLEAVVTGLTFGRFRGFEDANGDFHWLGVQTSGALDGEYVLDGVQALLGVEINMTGGFADLDGGIWVCGYFDSTTVGFYRVSGSGPEPAILTVSGLPPRVSTENPRGAVHFRDATRDHFVFFWEDGLFAASRADGTIVASYTAATLPAVNPSTLRPGSTSIWAGTREFSTADLSLIRALPINTWAVSGSSTFNVETTYLPALNALAAKVGSELVFLYLDRIAANTVTLASVCADVAERCGVQDYDFAALDQPVTGWSATRGAGSSILEPLLDAYDSDIRPHDFTIEGVKRSGVAAGAVLETARFVGEPRYGVSIRQSSELPRAIMIDFADIDADQQPNSVRSDRRLDATDARGEKKIDLTTLALDADEARGLADRHFRRIWNERQGVTLSLTAQLLSLEPGDVRTLSLDGQQVVARCVRLNVRADDVVVTEWRYDSPSLALLNGSSGAAFDGRAPSQIVVPVLSKGFVLDVPLLSDADEAAVPQAYALAAPYAAGAWPGATIFQEVGGEYSEELASIPSSSGASWGYVAELLPYANPNVWDRGNAMTITLQTGELTGCTEAAANADPSLNLAAIGRDGRWEIVQFTIATLVSGRTYTVSGFKRGRRGTEWAAELHAANDQFVLLDTATAQAMGLSEVGTAVSFKAISAGRTDGYAFGYDYEGQTLKPYAPAQLKALKLANGDWVISWVRRTRVGGAWVGGSTIPLGEASEEYELDLTVGMTTVTKAGLTASPYTWTVAAQTTDTGGEVAAGALAVAAYQISASVDRGFAAEITA